MWDLFAQGNEVFNAGVDHEVAAAEERLRLEREANDIDLWRSSEFAAEEDSSNPELLLDELEQEDVMSEILQNACTCNLNFLFRCFQYFGQI